MISLTLNALLWREALAQNSRVLTSSWGSWWLTWSELKSGQLLPQLQLFFSPSFVMVWANQIYSMLYVSSVPVAWPKGHNDEATWRYCKVIFFYFLGLPSGWVHVLPDLHHAAPSSPVTWSLICVSHRGCCSSVSTSWWLPSVPMVSWAKTCSTGGLTEGRRLALFPSESIHISPISSYHGVTASG